LQDIPVCISETQLQDTPSVYLNKEKQLQDIPVCISEKQLQDTTVCVSEERRAVEKQYSCRILQFVYLKSRYNPNQHGKRSSIF
jgi:hypothetical protein